MSDNTYTYQPDPGATSADGAYLRTPQEPSNYFNDANQFAAPQAAQAVQAAPSVSASTQPLYQNQTTTSTVSSWFNVTDATYLKGLLLGAGVALLVTNPKVQKAVVSGAVKTWAAIQGGVEELKEQVLDAKAELSQGE